jgi:large subunit ribosomal protein L10
MARPDKAADVAEITEHFRSSTATVLTEYRGLTVAQMKTLRRSLGENASYAVVKNTLTKIAAKEAGVEGLDDLLAGPSALAFVKGDPVEAAKGLRDFAKANPLLVIKGGYMDGRSLTVAEVEKIAELESREVLLAKAPHIVKPMRFVLPHRPHLRPAWMIRAGLFLYDHLGKRKRLPIEDGELPGHALRVGICVDLAAGTQVQQFRAQVIAVARALLPLRQMRLVKQPAVFELLPQAQSDRANCGGRRRCECRGVGQRRAESDRGHRLVARCRVLARGQGTQQFARGAGRHCRGRVLDRQQLCRGRLRLRACHPGSGS